MRHHKPQDIKKWHHIGIHMQGKINVYFELQKIMDLHLSNVNFKKYRNPAPAFSGLHRWYWDYQTRGGHPHLSWYGCQQISDGNTEIVTNMFNEDPSTSLETAASRVGLHHLMMWNFLKRDVMLFHRSYKCIKKSVIWTGRIGWGLRDIVEIS